MAQTKDTVKKPQPSPPPFPQGGFHNEVEIWSEAFRRISPTPPRPVAEDSPPRVHGGLVLAGGQNNWRTPCKNTDSAHRRHHGAASERRARAHGPAARVQAVCGGRGKMAGRGGGTSGTSGSGSASCIARPRLAGAICFSVCFCHTILANLAMVCRLSRPNTGCSQLKERGVLSKCNCHNCNCQLQLPTFPRARAAHPLPNPRPCTTPCPPSSRPPPRPSPAPPRGATSLARARPRPPRQWASRATSPSLPSRRATRACARVHVRRGSWRMGGAASWHQPRPAE